MNLDIKTKIQDNYNPLYDATPSKLYSFKRVGSGLSFVSVFALCTLLFCLCSLLLILYSLLFRLCSLLFALKSTIFVLQNRAL